MSLKSFVIMAVLISPLVYAHLHKPLLDDHKARILELASNGDETISEEQLARPEWNDGLEFVDWSVVTATRDNTKQSLVSFGIVKYIKVVDDDWGPKALGLTKNEGNKAP